MNEKLVNKIYFIPGLGFDQRMFSHLDLKDLDVNYLDWIEPQTRETIQSYARRLSTLIIEKEHPIVLVGHSLGGIIAQEIAAIKPIHKVILISSIQSRSEMPLFFKSVAPLKLYHLFTKSLTLKTVKYWGKNHGYVTADEQALFTSMVTDQTDSYLQWALKELSVWKAPVIPATTQLFHIHGTDDKTFPIKLLKNLDCIVEGGSHFMTYQRGEEMSEVLWKQLK